jgi:hypothetical protein
MIAGTEPAKSPLALPAWLWWQRTWSDATCRGTGFGSQVLAVCGTVVIEGEFAFSIACIWLDWRDRHQPVDSGHGHVIQGTTTTASPSRLSPSNGAITAAALLLTRPRLLAGAIPFRPLSPFTDDPTHRSDGVPVLIIDGENDNRRSPGGDRSSDSGTPLAWPGIPSWK